MKKLFGFVVLLAVLLVSCNKEPLDGIEDSGLDTKSAQVVLDEITVENAIAEVDYESDFYFRASHALTDMFRNGMKWGWRKGLRYKTGQCPLITIESEEGGYPKTITLDYGDSTVLRNGKVLSGIIQIYISARPRTDGFVKEVTYNGFSVDSVSIAGVTTMMFTGDNETERVHTVSSDLTITLADGSIIKREGEKVREWISGLDTKFDQSDDVIQVSGYAQITTAENDLYKMDITKPLIKLGDCRHYVEGVIEYSENGVVFATVDFGTGDCDNVATLTKDGETVEIDLAGKAAKYNHGNHHGGKG
ncbi:MAG: hypothetical protein GXO81_13725 [Chlorobi bacterium]|nr:hypothetical protein [Chlorobiota bacterium]